MEYSTLPGGFEPQPNTAEHLLESDSRAEISDARIEAISEMVMARVRAGDRGHAGVYSSEALPGGLSKPNRQRQAFSKWWNVVWILPVFAVIAVKYFPTNRPTLQTKTYRTANSQRATIEFTDGSTVTLAPATTLRVTGVTNRTIDLTGEALFTVSHKNNQPFIVKTGNTVTRVLGTTFSIRKYADDKQTRVAVAEGKVAVQSTILTNGDIAISGSSVTVQHDAERVLALLSFAQGRLLINDERLSQAATQLSRWLDLDIRFDSAAGSRRLSTVLQQETPSQALEDIARLTRTRYTRSGRVVTFSVD